jgi:hypothetical protein
MKRIIVTGSRNWPDHRVVRDTLDYVKHWQGDFLLIHGGCPTGADFMAENWAEDRGIQTEIYRAEWARLGKAAGPLRNTEMVRAGADYCIGFPLVGARSVGTLDCLRKAMRAKIQTWAIGIDGKATLL